MSTNKKTLPPAECSVLLSTLQLRFQKNMQRHKGINWADVQAKLKKNPEKLWTLNEMEITGGEPDVVATTASGNKKTDEYIFYDCTAESPIVRRSICYDHQALEARKEYKPANSAVQMAAYMGVELLTEAQYRQLQSCQMAGENFDTKQAGYKHLLQSENWAVHFFATAVTILFLYITMGQHLTTPDEVSVVF